MQFLAGNWPILVLVAVVFGVLLLSRLLLKETPVCPYAKRASLASAAELEFYHALCQAGEEEWAIFPLLRLADLITVQGGSQGPGLQTRIDFVLCDPETLEPELAILLDKNVSAEQNPPDTQLESALAAAGLPLLRIPAAEKYSVARLQEAIDEALD